LSLLCDSIRMQSRFGCVVTEQLTFLNPAPNICDRTCSDEKRQKTAHNLLATKTARQLQRRKDATAAASNSPLSLEAIISYPEQGLAAPSVGCASLYRVSYRKGYQNVTITVAPVGQCECTCIVDGSGRRQWKHNGRFDGSGINP
jgi:hypothetical protein